MITESVKTILGADLSNHCLLYTSDNARLKTYTKRS